MIYVFLRIVFNTCFSQGLKVAQARDGQMLPAALVNYGVAAVVTAGALFIGPHPQPQTVSVLLGIGTGVTYAGALLGLETAMRISGVSIAVAVLQLSVLVPTVVSMALFHERPSAVQFTGILAAVIALPLLSRSRAVRDAVPAKPVEIVVAVFLLFFVTGCSGVQMKMFQVYAPAADRQAYTAVLFLVSTLVIGVALVARKAPWGPTAIPVGTGVGIANVLQLEATLRGLSVLPAVILFPISSALTVAINALLSVWFWRERLDTKATVGIALAIVAAILINR